MRAAGDHVFVECDVADRGVGRTRRGRGPAPFGHIDVLVNNAGIAAIKPFLDMDDDLPEYHRVIAVNLHGTVYMTHAVGNGHARRRPRRPHHQHLLRRRGSLLRIERYAQVGYVASKAAINHLTAPGPSSSPSTTSA